MVFNTLKIPESHEHIHFSLLIPETHRIPESSQTMGHSCCSIIEGEKVFDREGT